LCDIIEVTTA